MNLMKETKKNENVFFFARDHFLMRNLFSFTSKPYLEFCENVYLVGKNQIVYLSVRGQT